MRPNHNCVHVGAVGLGREVQLLPQCRMQQTNATTSCPLTHEELMSGLILGMQNSSKRPPMLVPMIPRMTTQVRPQTLTCQTRKTAIFSYTGGDKKIKRQRRQTYEPSRRARKKTKITTTTGGLGPGGPLHCECIRLRDGAGPPGR